MAKGRKATPSRSRWDVHPAVGMVGNWVRTLKEKTGRDLDEWVALVEKEGPAGEKERRDWLRKERGLAMNSAWWIAEKASGGGTWDEDPDAYLRNAERHATELFSGARAGSRPLFDALVERGRALGGDVKICPCQTMVPFYRKFVFAEVRPTADGVELGLALGNRKPSGRLEPLARMVGNRVQHRVLLSSLGDLDAEVEGWLREAYEQGDRTQEKKLATAGPPADLEAALKRSKPAKATWDSMTPRMQSDWILFIESAKKAETRAARVARAEERLAAGKKTTY